MSAAPPGGPQQTLPGLLDRAPWVLGVDVSALQGRLDVPALVDAGVRFLWCRATVGEHDLDAELAHTARACDAAGLSWGAYGVLMPYGVGRAEGQARHFLATLQGLPSPTLPPVLDFELAKGLGAVDALRSACTWLDVVEQATGGPGILYAGPGFLAGLRQLGGAAAEELLQQLATRRLFVADYGRPHDPPAARLASRPHLPAEWAAWSVWQASGDEGGASLPWARTHVDVDWMTEETAADLLPVPWDARSTLETGAVVDVVEEQG